MTFKLPGWVIDDADSVRAEVEGMAKLTSAERLTLCDRLCRDAMWLIKAGGNAQAALAYQEPLPPSTVAALKRLRAANGWGQR